MTRATANLYRGTTVGWPGNLCMQAERRTCATTDPFVATVFAIHARNFGEAIVLFREHFDELIIESGNVFIEYESEVVACESPLEFAANSRAEIPVALAIEALRSLGYDLPVRLPSGQRLTAFLEWSYKNGQRLTAQQKLEFDSYVLEDAR